MIKPIILYHAKCPDGIAAAWAAWNRFGTSAEYQPVQYGEKAPDVTGRDVYIVDFSFPRQVLLDMAEKANRVTLLDHHKTAEADLKDLVHPKLEIHFDMNKSGATLTWDYFFGEDPCWLVQYAEDRDLWRHALPGSKEVNSYLQALPHDFGILTEVFEKGLEAAKEAGTGCLAWVRYYVDSTKKLSYQARFLGYDNIPVVNAPYTAISEVVGELSEGHPFAMGWHIREDGKVVYSLRSRGDFDVSALATTCGGGGHKNAAGFTLDLFPWNLTEPAVGP